LLETGHPGGDWNKSLARSVLRTGTPFRTQREERVMPSSVIRDYDYDADIQQLEITFVSGKVYVYSAVPENVFEDFLAARSKGEFFNANIRDAYAYREVTPATVRR